MIVVEPCQNCALFNKSNMVCGRYNMLVKDPVKSGCSWHSSSIYWCDVCHRGLPHGAPATICLEGEEYKILCPDCCNKL